LLSDVEWKPTVWETTEADYLLCMRFKILTEEAIMTASRYETGINIRKE
jgi:hypothetical protein